MNNQPSTPRAVLVAVVVGASVFVLTFGGMWLILRGVMR